MDQDEIREKFEKLTESEKKIFTMGRLSVLNEFDSICLLPSFMNLSDEEFNAVRKFFDINNHLRKLNNN